METGNQPVVIQSIRRTSSIKRLLKLPWTGQNNGMFRNLCGGLGIDFYIAQEFKDHKTFCLLDCFYFILVGVIDGVMNFRLFYNLFT